MPENRNIAASAYHNS